MKNQSSRPMFSVALITMTAVVALLCMCAMPVAAQFDADSSSGPYQGVFATRAVFVDNPRELAADVRNPFDVPAETHANTKWCAPGHHTPWGGDWAFDIWVDNGVAGTGSHPNATCGEDVYLRVSPSTLPEGTVPDRLRAKVVHVNGSDEFACGSNNPDHGGYQQGFEIYATYKGIEIAIGTIVYSHIEDRVFNVGDWIHDPMNVRIGTAYDSTAPSTDCWGGCHIHMEFENYDNTSCYQNVCQSLPETNIPTHGEGSIVGKLGGEVSGVQVCPTYDDDEKLPCATWDDDMTGCNSHQYNATQDCAYYTSSDKCRPRGTSNCAAGLEWECDDFDDEDYACSLWDGNVGGCDLHGISDPDKHNDTQDCAYYFGSGRCSARGTSNCAAGMWCAGAP